MFLTPSSVLQIHITRNATLPHLDNDVNDYVADIDFDSDSNDVVSSSIDNVGPGEPSVCQSVPEHPWIGELGF